MGSGYIQFQDTIVEKRADNAQIPVNNIPLAFVHLTIVYSPNGHAKDVIINQVNDKFVQLAGLPREFMLGKKLSEFSPDFEEIYNKEISQLIIHSLEFFPPHHELYLSSMKKWFDIYLNFINKHEATILLNDCTDRKEKEQQRGTEKKIKSDFLANMSHEIRTPLNGILGFTEILSAQESNARKKGMLNMVEDCGNQLLGIIEDIFKYANIESGKLAKNEIKFNPIDTILDTVGFFEKSASDKGLKLKTNINNIKATTLIGDVVKLNQVIVNLISNAIKFTDEGKIDIVAKTYRKNKRVHLNFVITDSGIGIDPTSINNIFDEFKQLDHYLTKRIRGIGIGLTITKKIVDFLEGEIEVISKPNNGSTFVIDIPFTEVKEKNPVNKEINQKVTEMQTNEKIKILLAEDNEANQFLIKALTKNTGWELTVVDDGQQAVETYKKETFDLILMDVQMPNLNGYDATKMIRKMESEKGIHTPIIALTAFAMKSDKDQCIEAGMDNYISKPFKRQQFMDVIDEAIRNRNK
jgi:signal transduction histidine kinase/CheY-like chemotaxis protein